MKKVLSLVLGAALAFGMATTGFAAIADETTDVTVIPIGASGIKTSGGTYDYTDQGATGSVYLGEEVRAGSKYALVAYTNQDASGNPTDLTTSMLSRDKITLKVKTSKGSSIIKAVEFKNGTGTYNGSSIKYVYAQVEFIDPFVSTKEQDFDFEIYQAYKGTKIAGTEVTVSGALENEVIEVDEDDSVNLSDGQVAKALSYTKGIEIDTGNGLYIKTNMFEDKKYYAKSVQEIKAADDEITAKYPEIDTIYYLYTINLTSASNIVSFDIDDKYYVYNADGKYIGTTADKLPLSKKYYLTTKKIDMEGDVSDETSDTTTETPADTAPVDVESPITGGDDVPANANDNPGTGANGFVNVAVVAGVIALAAAGAVSMKK